MPNRSSFLLVATCIAALIHSVHADSSHFLGSQPVSLWVSFTGHESTMCSHVGRLLAVLTIYLFGQIRRLRGGSELWTTKPSVVTWFRCFDPPKQTESVYHTSGMELTTSSLVIANFLRQLPAGLLLMPPLPRPRRCAFNTLPVDWLGVVAST